ncbi:hypothetical protein COS61_02510 [Candidatus Wolfebacteria bacterium CG03_land_8_20_14_0_80_40_12]|uniref:DNA polymerase III subunit delta n=1 Tax=Candidatus Wolfebacteria bacterium CG03_land_8_20_14_0_80_40_12 TaxID=1975069 RepID=A0A2M7B581_9BACT|nr:MAG: hypothetical protein COS61_02510 [Candidatus Wolfebacteria bacterium CG03_land_8_20_14_0_80_40_12]
MVGYENLVNNFKNLINNGRLSHAYLFYGADQEKQFLFAQSLANFLEKKIFKPSDALLSETLIISPDEENVIGIDRVRSLKHFLWQKPANSIRRLAIIKEARNLTFQAQHAALKIVEEPPESALIIFIAKTIDDLFLTLSSRLQKIYFSSQSNRRESAIEEDIDQFFESLIRELRKDPIKNSQKLKEVLRRLSLIKQFNVNKRLQIKSL